MIISRDIMVFDLPAGMIDNVSVPNLGELYHSSNLPGVSSATLI